MRRTHRNLALRALLGLAALGAALPAPTATLASTTAPTAATATAACDEGRWPARVQGRPVTFRAGARAGDYLWHDLNGWHLRVTHPGTARVVFNGTIISDAPLTVRGHRLDSADRFTLSADRLTLTYRLVNHGRIDGLDIRTACASRLWFRGSMAGVRLPVGRIWIGRAGTHPPGNPFVITR